MGQTTLAQIREDLADALDTLRATMKVNGADPRVCPCCGAVGSEADDPAAYDDGAIRHDPTCFVAIAGSLVVPAPAR